MSNSLDRPRDSNGNVDRTIDAALAALWPVLPADLTVACGPTVAAAVEAAGRRTTQEPIDALGPGTVSAVVLVDDEVSTLGDQADQLVSEATDALRIGGWLVLSARAGDTADRSPRGTPAARESPPPRTGPRVFDPLALQALLAHRGLAVSRLEEHGDRLLAVAVAPVSEQERSKRFIASLPFKLVTAAVLVRDDQGRILCVFDAFRHHWTIPGGVVDAAEDPRTAALREGVEESGVPVMAGELLGCFQTAVPDRLLMVWGARPADPSSATAREPVTRQPHEIGDVEWLPVPEALRRLNRRTRWQVEQCLEHPGETWRE